MKRVVKKIKKERKIIYSVLVALLLFINILVLLELFWLEKNVGTVSFDEIIFHLRVPKEGTSTDLVKSNLFRCIIPSILVSLGMFYILFRSYKYKFCLIISLWKKEIKIYIQYAFLVCLIILNVVILVWRLEYIDSLFNIKGYIKSQNQKSTFIEENYVDPKDVKLEFPEEKRNLIYIYIESMETTFENVSFDDKVDYNLIPKLTELSNDNIYFSDTDGFGGLYQVKGTSWTAGGMIGQTAGIPLLLPMCENCYVGYDSFLPNIYSLGDILKENGYNQEIMMGSSIKFAGKDVYFKTHGNYLIKDFDTAKEDGVIAKDYYSNWGFEDGILYSYAKDEITRLSKEGKPFNFTLLTANTHFPDGYTEKDCEKISKKNDYVNSIYCSQNQIAEFVKWLKSQDFYDNTTIVMVGDHVSMAANEIIKDSMEYRRIYNVIINSSISSENTKRRQASSIDMFPTTLAALGVKIEGNTLGLGVNLFSDEKTLIEKNGFEYVNEEFSKKSDYYNKFLYNN